MLLIYGLKSRLMCAVQTHQEFQSPLSVIFFFCCVSTIFLNRFFFHLFEKLLFPFSDHWHWLLFTFDLLLRIDEHHSIEFLVFFFCWYLYLIVLVLSMTICQTLCEWYVFYVLCEWISVSFFRSVWHTMMAWLQWKISSRESEGWRFQ